MCPPSDRTDEKSELELFTVLYQELRDLARVRLSKVPPGNTLQPTALVHEAYLRLAGKPGSGKWNGRGHFFGAAAEAMRQILVDQARRKSSQKRGGDRKRLDLDGAEPSIEVPVPAVDLLALDEALSRLEKDDPLKARLVKLRYFVGLSREESAAILDIPLRTCDRHWRFVVARLHRDLSATTMGEVEGNTGGSEKERKVK